MQKEENDFVIFDIREEIIENALKIAYYHYMERQNVKFTVHCAIKAWLQTIDWYVCFKLIFIFHLSYRAPNSNIWLGCIAE